jgi:hypothetical protein
VTSELRGCSFRESAERCPAVDVALLGLFSFFIFFSGQRIISLLKAPLFFSSKSYLTHVLASLMFSTSVYDPWTELMTNNSPKNPVFLTVTCFSFNPSVFAWPHFT